MANSASGSDSSDDQRRKSRVPFREKFREQLREQFRENLRKQFRENLRVYKAVCTAVFVYKRAFSLLDEDNDERISMLDIQRCLEFVGHPVDIDTLKKIFQNQSNLTYEEFLRSVECDEEDKKVDDRHEEFRKYSEKDNGCGITAKGLKKMLSKLREKRTTQQCVNISVLNKIIRNYRNQHLDLLSEDGFFRSVVWEEEDKKVDGLHKEFRKYEKDDGCGITAKSLKKMLSTLGEERRTKQCLNMIKMVNPNGDDVINFEEFKVLRFFSTFLKRVEYNIQIVGVRESPRGQGRKIDKD